MNMKKTIPVLLSIFISVPGTENVCALGSYSSSLFDTGGGDDMRSANARGGGGGAAKGGGGAARGGGGARSAAPAARARSAAPVRARGGPVRRVGYRSGVRTRTVYVAPRPQPAPRVGLIGAIALGLGL